VNLLYHPEHSSTANKQRVATVVAHETAHQWFGDLVTCDYWNYVWLNEGFATYFEFFGTHWVESPMELNWQFVVVSMQNGLQVDSLESTRAMSTENAPTQVTYNKAGSVLRMMEHLVGSNTYMLALQDYFKLQLVVKTFSKET
jgi:aminopeptidase N